MKAIMGDTLDNFRFPGIFSVEKSDKPTGSRIIKGYMSIPKVDAENEIIDRKAYPDAINEVRRRLEAGRPVPLFVEHRRKELSLPIGKLIDAGEDNKGLWFKAEIAKGPIGDSVWDLIEQGILYGCSMGGDALKTHMTWDHKVNKDIRIIDKMVFRELSLTGMPVNDDAVFSISKSMYCKHEGNCASHIRKSTGLCACKAAAQRISKVLENIDNAMEEDVVKRFQKSVDNLQKEPDNKDYFAQVKASLKQLTQVLGIENQLVGLGEKIQKLAPEVAPEAEAKLEGKPEQKPEIKPEEKPQKKEEDFAIGQAPTAKPITTYTEDQKQDEEKKIMEAHPKKALVEPKPISSIEEINSKLDKLTELLMKKEGGETNNVEKEKFVKCPDCETFFEKSDDYAARFCPKCGADLMFDAESDIETETDEGTEYAVGNKPTMPPVMPPVEELGEEVAELPMDEGEDLGEDLGEELEEAPAVAPAVDEEEMVDEEEEEDANEFACSSCKSMFEKSDGYDMNYCPECGGQLEKSDKMSIAIASAPKGAITKYEKKPTAKKGGSGDSIAVADNPKGAKTKYKGKSRRDLGLEKNLDVRPMGTAENTGDSVPSYQRQTEGQYINDNPKVRTDMENSAMHDWKGPNYVPIYEGVDAGQFSNYERDRVGKSLLDAIDDRLNKFEKSIDIKLRRTSVGRKSLVPTEDTKIEKSASVEEQLEKDKNRFLAKVFTGKIKLQ